MAEERRLSDLAAEQWGLVTFAQCAALGFSKNFAWRRVSSRAWTRVHRSVFKTSSSSLTPGERDVAALLAAGAGAVLSHQSAARHLRLDVRQPSIVQVTIPDERRIATPKGVRVWRSRDIDLAATRSLGPLTFTGIARTMLDLATVLAERWLRVALDSALRLHEENLSAIEEALDRDGKGHTGTAKLRTLLDSYDQGTESALESLVLNLIRDLRPAPFLQHPIFVDGELFAKLDLAWPDIKLCAELDGWKHHSSLDAFRRDRARDRLLSQRGWEVLRFTWTEATQKPAQLVVELKQAIARCTERHAPRPDNGVMVPA